LGEGDNGSCHRPLKVTGEIAHALSVAADVNEAAYAVQRKRAQAEHGFESRTGFGIQTCFVQCHLKA